MNTRDRLTGGRAVVAARDADSTPDTTEIRRLAAAAGYDVVGEVTQRRTEDLRYDLGAGKARDLAATVADADADAVVYDGELSPGQYADLLDLFPAGTTLVDRYRLVLDVFAEGAGSAAARTQVRLATLRYELPRLERMEGESALNRKVFEKGSPVLDARRRIDDLEAKLDDLADAAADRRERRREEGFDLVTLAGYTNAGKSTLLRRLADDLTLDPTDPDGASRHADLADSASVEDRLFETLETTTRRATLGGRRVLLTDTVGLVADLPHDLVRSFSATLDEVAAGDVVLAVVDASADDRRLRRRVETTVEVLAGDATGPVVPVLNKVDRLDEAGRAAAEAVVADVLGDSDADVRDTVAISALDGAGVDDLRAAVRSALPDATAAFTLPMSGEAQALVSWIYEHGDAAVEYGPETVEVRFSGKPSVVAEARRRAIDLRDGTTDGAT
ncbi:GTPase HflX [Halobaculum gomorrense]|uniref:GTP-binding protein HflX n=1 Tax=Halobaculum gomorrense TaxID=43928 RepID=A0A1M5UJ73_9EURY|nr:GTPase HflX [Halobaculum gomorrense]SHH62703.1 GTP-binding protein HflX [Halobaculum gomorrense]